MLAPLATSEGVVNSFGKWLIRSNRNDLHSKRRCSVALNNSLELMLTSKRLSAGIAGTNENSNHSSCYSSIVCGDSGLFCSEPANGDVETQRGKIESGARIGQEHDCHLFGAGG